ncbi:MAG: thioredoxin fold domain-containing protein [Burkholderiales bacterium]|nr:thioredoxin fold domain-containing protein [Burkholderiales bacterium]
MIRRSIAAALVAACAAWAPAQAAPSPGQLADAMLRQMAQTTAVTLGSGPHVVDVFFDPNCPYCHHLYEDLQPWVGKQGLQLRWIPVAVLAPSSEGKAAAMLQAADTRKALARNEDDYDENPRAGSGGGIVPAPKVAAATRDELARNLKVLHAAGAYFAFPLMVWRDKSGQAQMFLGAPRDAAQLKALLASVR